MQTKKPWRIGTKASLLLRGLRYRALLPYAAVDGWLTVDEAIALYELARGLGADRPLAVEIGCWQGKSSICLAKGLVGKREPVLCCIDPFDASGDRASSDDYRGRAADVHGQLRAAFEHNLAAAGVRGLVEVLPGYSHELAAGFTRPIDLLFLDGDHAYAAIRNDFAQWAPKLRPGGMLALHDVVHPVHDGPRRVVEEIVQKDPCWVEQRYVDSMFVARRASS